MNAIALFIFFLATFVKPKGGRIGGVGEATAPPDFGRIEGGIGQHMRAALLLNNSDFQTLRHTCLTFNNQISDIDTEEKKTGGIKSVKKVKKLKNYASMDDILQNHSYFT